MCQFTCMLKAFQIIRQNTALVTRLQPVPFADNFCRTPAATISTDRLRDRSSRRGHRRPSLHALSQLLARSGQPRCPSGPPRWAKDAGGRGPNGECPWPCGCEMTRAGRDVGVIGKTAERFQQAASVGSTRGRGRDRMSHVNWSCDSGQREEKQVRGGGEREDAW